MLRIIVRPLAQQDISENSEYLDSQAGFAVAERFLAAIRSEFEVLSKRPQIGSLCGFKSYALRAMRRWPITGFERWLIFYEVLDSGIYVARVLHGARDLESIFD